MAESNTTVLAAYHELVNDLVSDVACNETGIAVAEFELPEKIDKAFDEVALFMSSTQLRNTAPTGQPKAEFVQIRTGAASKVMPSRRRALAVASIFSDPVTQAVAKHVVTGPPLHSIAYNRHEPGAVGIRHRDAGVSIAVALMKGAAYIEYADDLSDWEDRGPRVAEIKESGLLVVRGRELSNRTGPGAPFHRVSEPTGQQTRRSIPLVYLAR